LKSQKALWGSNDGALLLYATFNDTNVGQMMYPWFSSDTLIQSGEHALDERVKAPRVIHSMLVSRFISQVVSRAKELFPSHAASAIRHLAL
jgi:enoyl reductase-like protein